MTNITRYVSCEIISIDEFDDANPVNSPIVNIKINPIGHKNEVLKINFDP